jgi:thiol:disulfide interchange protein DsbG
LGIANCFILRTMTSKIILSVFFAASFLIAGCGESTSHSTAKAATTAVSIEAITAETKGFSVGSAMSARTVYVFFDAQCPHCGALWYSAKPLKSQARFVWIPVGLMNAASTSQGAALLAASDGAAAMDAHEASMMAKSGGIGAASNSDAQKEAVRKNTELMTRFGFASIPSVVAVNAQTGQLVKNEGAMQTAELAKFLGLQVPAF